MMVSILLTLALCHIIFTPTIVLAENESQSSTITGIEIVGKKTADIQSEIASHISEWKKQDIVIQGMTAEIMIPADAIQFDVRKTVDHFLTATSKP